MNNKKKTKGKSVFFNVNDRIKRLRHRIQNNTEIPLVKTQTSVSKSKKALPSISKIPNLKSMQIKKTNIVNIKSMHTKNNTICYSRTLKTEQGMKKIKLRL